MNRTWNFTDLEFIAQWEALKQDYLPEPFVYTCRTWVNEDYIREQQDALARLRHSGDRSFDGVLEVLAFPDLRIVAEGYDPADQWNPNVQVRLHGVRRGDRGYVFAELSGETYWHSGGFTVTECDAVDLAGAIVRALPAVEPGRRADVVLSTQDQGDGLDYSLGRSAVHDSFDDSIADRSAEFLVLPISRIGTIDVIQGRSRFGPRGITRHRLQWRDLRDDGRYAIDDQTPPVARAIDAKHLTALINTRVAEVVRAIKDERV
ncbi:ESX secretion-associated protein EspG [Nocardia sp. NPDC005998]|uniref:ESX secretion-associated protein EspG n=1 Tax=Nocardia sp. NPDC005998 TaxID=3156894 RepID=UPI0033A639F2